jgi:hypothetical protein
MLSICQMMARIAKTMNFGEVLVFPAMALLPGLAAGVTSLPHSRASDLDRPDLIGRLIFHHTVSLGSFA